VTTVQILALEGAPANNLETNAMEKYNKRYRSVPPLVNWYLEKNTAVLETYTEAKFPVPSKHPRYSSLLKREKWVIASIKKFQKVLIWSMTLCALLPYVLWMPHMLRVLQEFCMSQFLEEDFEDFARYVVRRLDLTKTQRRTWAHSLGVSNANRLYRSRGAKEAAWRGKRGSCASAHAHRMKNDGW